MGRALAERSAPLVSPCSVPVLSSVLGCTGAFLSRPLSHELDHMHQSDSTTTHYHYTFVRNLSNPLTSVRQPLLPDEYV